MTKKIVAHREYEVEMSGEFAGDNVSDVYVGVIIKGMSIDVTPFLNKLQLEHIEAVLAEEAENEELTA